MLRAEYCKERLERLEKEMQAAKMINERYTEEYIEHLKRLKVILNKELREAEKREPTPISLTYWRAK